MNMGKGCIYEASVIQKFNTKSSTEAELVSVSDALPRVIWYQNFLRDQWYQVNDSIIYQDNQRTIQLCNNGRPSSSRRNRHIDIHYFFITDRIKYKEVSVGENKVGSLNTGNRDVGSDDIKQAVDTREIIARVKPDLFIRLKLVAAGAT